MVCYYFTLSMKIMYFNNTQAPDLTLQFINRQLHFSAADCFTVNLRLLSTVSLKRIIENANNGFKNQVPISVIIKLEYCRRY